MNCIVKILKGILIGVANVIPGLSGGTIAVSMGIYEDLIYSVNNIFKKFTVVIKSMWTYILGVVIGIVLGVFGIVTLFNLAPIPTTMFFVGLILGSLPEISKKIESKTLRLKDFILFIILAGIIMFLPMINTTAITKIETNFTSTVIMFLLGIVAAATMVIPGVSGSMMLMALGYYTAIMTTISLTIKQILTFDIVAAFTSGKMIIPFGIGIIAGIFLMAKLIGSLIKKDETLVYWGILGLIIVSPFPIILNLNLIDIPVPTVIISSILLVVGTYLTILLSKISAKKE